jgi:hypothetical protein
MGQVNQFNNLRVLIRNMKMIINKTINSERIRSKARTIKFKGRAFIERMMKKRD